MRDVLGAIVILTCAKYGGLALGVAVWTYLKAHGLV